MWKPTINPLILLSSWWPGKEKGCTWERKISNQLLGMYPCALQTSTCLVSKLEVNFSLTVLYPLGHQFLVLFKDITTLIHWIAERRECQKFIHSLDDFFTVNKYFQVCHQTMAVLKQVCKEIKMPITPEKLEGPVVVVEFLGLTLDPQFMVIWVPQDKLKDILQIISKMIKDCKATSWELQSLAGKLNLISKAVPAVKSFIKRVYQVHEGIPHYRHVDLRSPAWSDLCMRKVFPMKFRG